ncbi:MAG: hypothetical protein CL579_05540 [Alteromonadaceae bacterium]|jgi:hypothetical protein|uniref:hypothetical protein n=1 Tax=Pseudoalteromonas atlantica (strain T6c / ATCC BAA-1087) TaxID=3042615 RepID=UPI0005A2EA21|nr:hypothetical protein [Paraglaciecola sp. T6c]MAD15530.1 hypothetical protein [Alteromonadaceae bacterium]MBB19973.1 hypothetical protein [Rickettsiales bacterium]
MKTFLLLHIALLCALGYVSQSIFFGTLGDILFTVASVICIPIVSAYALKCYFSFTAIRQRNHKLQ